jgi:hypothetical protein
MIQSSCSCMGCTSKQHQAGAQHQSLPSGTEQHASNGKPAAAGSYFVSKAVAIVPAQYKLPPAHWLNKHVCWAKDALVPALLCCGALRSLVMPRAPIQCAIQEATGSS